MGRAKPIIITLFVVVAIAAVGFAAYTLGAKKNTVSSSNNNSQNTTTSTSSKNSYVASNEGLTSFPDSALSNRNIVLLDLSHNQITTLPSQIGQLTRLEDFNISYNMLTGSLPGEIRKMSLKNLNASYNRLTGVPAEIGQQQNLRNINFSYNQLTGLPNELSNIPVVDVLDLSYNSIDSITDLSKYKNVKTLKLTGNKLTASQISQLQAALPSTQIISN